MAIDEGTATVTLTKQERSWRINIETPKDADPVVTVYRQLVSVGSDGSVSIADAPTAARNLSAIVSEQQPFTPSVPGQITGAELAGLIAARADMWREQDKQ